MNAAAQLVLAGHPASISVLAKILGCSEHMTRAVRSDLIDRKLWPYKSTYGHTQKNRSRSELAAAQRRLGIPEPRTPVIANPVTPLALRVAHYRQEWYDGVNFLISLVALTEE